MTTWKRGAALALGLGAWIGLGALIEGCEESRGRTGPPGASATPAPISTNVGRDEPLPGVTVEILSVAPGSGPGGNLLPGDQVAVTYMVTTVDGRRWELDQLDAGEAVMSGPTFNYQLVLGPRQDVRAASTENPDGSFTYVFADPLPQVYPAPLNDTPSFGLQEGELQGRPLVDGTYTVGLRLYKQFSVQGEGVRDPGVDTQHVLVGTSTSLQGLSDREVVTNANCRQCHVNVLAHGNTRMDVDYCVLCHTAGAEDRNVASAAGGSPGVSIDFKVMIHKIHAGAHLPSVVGVSTGANGERLYSSTAAITSTPYQVVGFGNNVIDYSHVGFPDFPNLNQPMPRDANFLGLTPAERAQDDQVRRGPTDCARCHGDPDGSGPLAAPAQGDVAFSQPSMRACGSCHDDIIWSLPYHANGQTMPPQANDSACADCHLPTASLAASAPLPSVGGTTDLVPLAIREAHVHPLEIAAIHSGLNFAITAVTEAGANNGDGDLDQGEQLQITFTVTDDLGNAVPLAAIDRIAVAAAGPLDNRQTLIALNDVKASVTGTNPFTVIVPLAGAGESVTSVPAGSGGIPGAYPPPLNDSPLDPAGDDVLGEWSGKPLVNGFYQVGVWGRQVIVVRNAADPAVTTTYNAASIAAVSTFTVNDAALAGTVPAQQTVEAISSEANCFSCHEKIIFHGGNRAGLRSCLFCHGAAGAEDHLAGAAAGNATVGQRIDFRTMLHALHQAAELEQPLVVSGFGGAPITFEHIVFPALPGGAAHCEKCHGEGTSAWEVPSLQRHPTQPAPFVLEWGPVCGSCHDDPQARTHIQLQTLRQPGLGESCLVCHGPGATESVRLVHENEQRPTDEGKDE